MENLYARLDREMVEAGLSGRIRKHLEVIFEAESIPAYKALRLVKLFNNLRSGGIRTLSHVEKRDLLKNFHDFVAYRKEACMSKIGYLFFETRLPPKRPAYVLPREMIKALVDTGKWEKDEKVKEKICAILLKKEMHLEKFIVPDDFICGLWFENPITRNNLIRFLFHWFSPDSVLAAVMKQVERREEKIPTSALKQLIGTAGHEDRLRQKKHLLADILRSSLLRGEEIDRVWSDFLKEMTRFDLIRMLSSRDSGLNWVADLRAECSQLSFRFKSQEGNSCWQRSFEDRVTAIMNRGPVSLNRA